MATPEQYFSEDIPTLLVSFARSGNSPESVAALQVASACLSRCFHLVLTCNQGGQLYQYCQTAPGALAVLMPAETNDQSLAMTSSFSSMMMAAMAILLELISIRKKLKDFVRDLRIGSKKLIIKSSIILKVRNTKGLST